MSVLVFARSGCRLFPLSERPAVFSFSERLPALFFVLSRSDGSRDVEIRFLPFVAGGATCTSGCELQSAAWGGGELPASLAMPSRVRKPQATAAVNHDSAERCRTIDKKRLRRTGFNFSFIFMHLFSPRQSSNKFGSALGLSETLNFIRRFLASAIRASSIALGLPKTFVLQQTFSRLGRARTSSALRSAYRKR